MKTLYESILDSDFDTNEEGMIESVIKKTLDDACWDKFEGEFTVNNNDTIVLYWNDGSSHEILFDELYSGLQDLKKLGLNIKAINFGMHTSIQLHVSRNKLYKGLKLWARSFEITDYTYGSSPIKVTFDDFSFLATGSCMFRRVLASMKGKCLIDCVFLELNRSKVSGAGLTIHADRINVTHVYESIKRRLKSTGLIKCFEKGAPIELPVALVVDLNELNPIKDILGLKPNNCNDVRKIVIVDTYEDVNDSGFVFAYNSLYPKSDVLAIYELEDRWKLYTTQRVSRDLYIL